MPATDTTTHTTTTGRDIGPLRERLLRVEARVWQRNVVSLALWLVGGALLAFAAYFVLDYLTHFPAAIRVLLTLAVLGAFGVWLPRRHRAYWTRERDVNRLARRVEREVAARRPGGFGSVLVSGLEFGTRAEIGGSATLKGRVIDQSLSESFDPLQLDLHDAGLQRRGLQTMAGAVAVFLIWALVSSATLGVFARRALGMAVLYPTRTQLADVQHPVVVKEFTDIVVTVKAVGVLPSSGALRVNYDGESAFDVALVPTETGAGSADGGALYHATIAGPGKPLSFRVRLGDANSETYAVRVVRPPVAIEGAMTVRPPAYTGIAPRHYDLSNITLPQGSRLDLRVKPDRPVATCELILGGEARPMTADGDGYVLSDLAIDAASGASVRLVDAEGIENTDRITYRIGVIADREPAIRLAQPENESYWAPVSKLHWEARLSDDYGLRQARLRMQTAEQTEDGADAIKATRTQPLPLTAGQLEATLEGNLTVSETGTKPGQLLLLTVQVRDAGPADEGDDETLWHNSETLRLHVVTSAELREIILAEEQLAYKQIGDVTDDVKHQIRMMQMQEQLNGGPQ